MSKEPPQQTEKGITMTDIKDGGRAFPVPGEYSDDGMSLRDYFAGQFAAAWVVALSARHKEPGYRDADVVHEANVRGLEQADAMLKERSR